MVKRNMEKNISLYELHEETKKRIVLSYLLEDERRLAMSKDFFFYNYVCRFSSLEAKSLDLLKKLSFFDKRGVINSNRTRVEFFNENGYSEGTFDGAFIYDIEFGLVCWVIPKDGSFETNGKCLLRFKNKEAMVFESWMDFRNKLMKDEEFANMLKKRIYFE
jgi:hypothetical protein